MAWTKEQQLAIDVRDKTLLVSAAAGSGKTATLTARIIESILDEENPQDIGRMLIATYTNAAVDELRDRIGKAIKKAALENPENSRLEEQLLRLKDAKILTITSFCNSILRSSAESVGISPNYRIAEPAEAKILSSSVLEALINAAYEGEIPDVCSPEEFIELADCLANVKRGEGLADALSFVFEKLTYSTKGIETLSELIKEYDPELFTSPDNTKMGKYIISVTKSTLNEYKTAYKKVIAMASDEKVDVRNLPKALSELSFIENVFSAPDYEATRALLASFPSERLSRGAKDAITDFYISFKTLHTFLGEDLKDISSSFFIYSTEEWKCLYTKLYKLLNILYRFLKKYYDVFMSEKHRRSICEFSDVERYAYNALYEENGDITPLAKELSEKFDAIYVDEYQDVNELQNMVFSAIAKSNNRFMVGDIKQSIYGFRSARPEIFREMKDKFPPINESSDSDGASIFMSNNFRCDEEVIDFVNGIFDTVFGLIGDTIGYVREDRLQFSKIHPDNSEPTHAIPEIHLIQKPKRATSDSTDSSDNTSDEEQTAAKTEAEEIAIKISELIGKEKLANGSYVEPRDVAVLMRSVGGALAIEISESLKKRGIPTELTETGDLFVCEEVLLALSFLYAIDNPRKDVYLAALMLSPLYSFTADELLKIRRLSKKESLYECLEEYSLEHPDDVKAERFISSLSKYRKLAEGKTTNALLSYIYRESGLLALASKSGGRENLMLLYSYARKYEGTDFKGLYSFISYVNEIIAKGEEFSKASSEGNSNAVKIMTVHKSKGLEFPVTILAGAAAQGSKRNDSRLIFNDGCGIAIKIKDDTGLAIVDNPVYNAISHYIQEKEFDEEQRVLYVALTRARERLYVFGVCPKTDIDEYLEKIDAWKGILSPFFMRKAKSFLEVILLARNTGKLILNARTGKTESTLNEQNSDEVSDFSDNEIEASTDCKEDAAQDFYSEELKNELISRFKFEYPHSHLVSVPEKLSVSKLMPTTLDEYDDGSVSVLDTDDDILPYADDEFKPTLPEFITGVSERESAKRGIATHTVLQFCDFEKMLTNGTRNELDRLEKEKFISSEDKERVRIGEIDKFVRSPLFEEILKAKKIYRELRFNVNLPAEKFTEQSERQDKLSGSTILVQGVIDAIIEDSDGNLHLVDYKTDRLTKDELADEKAARNRLISTHRLQLSYYAEAVNLMFGRAPKKVGIYSLHLGKEIEITI